MSEATPFLKRRLRRQGLLAFFEELPPCLVGMEAYSSAHHWARELVELGHDVRLIPPQYVKPYVKRNKTDAAGLFVTQIYKITISGSRRFDVPVDS
jgi:transposase